MEDLKLYEPSLIIDTNEVGIVPTVDDFSPEYFDELVEHIILNRRIKTSQRGHVEYLPVGFKGMHSSKAKWPKKEKVRAQIP